MRCDVVVYVGVSVEGGREKDGCDEVGIKVCGVMDVDGGGIFEFFGGVVGGVRGDGVRRGGERK